MIIGTSIKRTLFVISFITVMQSTIITSAESHSALPLTPKQLEGDRSCEKKHKQCKRHNKHSSSYNGLALTPPMGWNSVDSFGANINEDIIKANADAMVSSGMKDAGYQYIIVDDGWFSPEGRDANGNLLPDPTKFPSGMKALGDYIHGLGLKFGIYGSPDFYACRQAAYQVAISTGDNS